MLYLLGMRSDSSEIDLITVDCFNDVTGISENFEKLWDVQSKNHGSLPPQKLEKVFPHSMTIIYLQLHFLSIYYSSLS